MPRRAIADRLDDLAKLRAAARRHATTWREHNAEPGLLRQTLIDLGLVEATPFEPSDPVHGAPDGEVADEPVATARRSADAQGFDPDDVSWAPFSVKGVAVTTGQHSPKRGEVKTPGALNRADRHEERDIPLQVITGEVPADLAGHYFAMCVTGNTEDGLPRGTQAPWFVEMSKKLPKHLRKLLPDVLTHEPTTTVLNSDAFMLRFTFDEDGPRATTRIGRGPDYYADAATRESNEEHFIGRDTRKHRRWIKKYGFHDSGLLRLNGALGLRNMNNTAFQPITSKDEGKPPRMLITWDAGQPWEIDTDSLELVTPVGRRDQWTAEALGIQPFKTVFTTAHPAWDARTRETFFINYGKGMLGLMQGLPALRDLRFYLRHLDSLRIRTLYDLDLDVLVDLEVTLRWLLEWGVQELTPERIYGLVPQTFLRLKVWDGESETLKTLNVQEQGIDVAIEESVHQIAVTKNFIIIMDTGFKVGINALYGDAIPGLQALSTLIRTWTTRTVRPYATLHIVSRGDVAEAMASDEDVNRDGSRDVEAFRIDLPVAACHFLADYEDHGGRIVAHVAHCDATDVSEWLRSEDKGVVERDEVARELLGLPSLSGMDINRLARYTIDCDQHRVVDTRILEEEPFTWTLALYAHQTAGRPVPLPDEYRNLFWCSMGFSEDLAFGRLYGLYVNYIHRTVPLAGIKGMLEQMKHQPATLFRLNAKTMTIDDAYVFAPGWVSSSPQFAPRRVVDGVARDDRGWRLVDGVALDPEVDGYLLCTVYGPDKVGDPRKGQLSRQRVPEIWVFDAADLAAGPVCRLWSPKLIFGYSIHTAFVDEIGPRDEDYFLPVMESLTKNQPKDIAEFLRTTVGPYFE